MKETSLIGNVISSLSFIIYPFQSAINQDDELKGSIAESKPFVIGLVGKVSQLVILLASSRLFESQY